MDWNIEICFFRSIITTVREDGLKFDIRDPDELLIDDDYDEDNDEQENVEKQYV